MIRANRLLAAASFVVALAGLTGSPAAQTSAPGDAGPWSERSTAWVRVSLDPEDPNVQTGTDTEATLIRFYVFAQGRVATRGIDYGLEITGGKYVGYNTATDRAWVILPVTDGLPASIGQAIVGPDCFSEPMKIGTLLVEPDEAGGLIRVDATRSSWSGNAYMLDCTNQPVRDFVAYGACLNGRPSAPHPVKGGEPKSASQDETVDGPDSSEEDVTSPAESAE